MNPGTYTPDDLTPLARSAHEASGLTQAAAAERLGVTPQSYGQALSDRTGLDALRRRIIEEFSPYDVVGPEYRLIDKAQAGESDA